MQTDCYSPNLIDCSPCPLYSHRLLHLPNLSQTDPNFPFSLTDCFPFPLSHGLYPMPPNLKTVPHASSTPTDSCLFLPNLTDCIPSCSFLTDCDQAPLLFQRLLPMPPLSQSVPIAPFSVTDCFPCPLYHRLIPMSPLLSQIAHIAHFLTDFS